MESTKLLSYSNVGYRIKKCLFAKDGSHGYLRSMIMGNLFVSFFVQIGLFREIRQSILLGQLPWYTSDLIILWLGIVEMCIAVGIGGVFRGRRRNIIIAAMLQLDVLALLMLAGAGDDVPTGNEFCAGAATYLPSGHSGLTMRAALRLTVFVVILTSVSVTLTTAWSHGLSYMNESQSEGLLVHYGILIAARIIGLMLFSRVLGQMPSWMLTIAICGQLTVHILQFLKVPSQPPGFQPQTVPPSFLSSVGRVLSNRVAVAQMFAVGFLVGALWGFVWYERDVVKTKYLLTYVENWQSMYADVLRYHFIVLTVLFIAMKYTAPMMAKFCQLQSAAKMMVICSFWTIPLFLVALLLLQCNRGSIAGLTSTVYRQPGCSASCRCVAPFDSFAPVCAVDTMTTYLSPCQAGCFNTEVFNGLSVLTNCQCGSTGKMAPGPCAVESCYVAFELHKLFYLFIIIFTVITLQLQGGMLLRYVEPVDTSIAVGIMSTVVAFVAFVCGNSAFFVANAYTCAWFQGGQCQFHRTSFIYALAGLCGGFALVAFVINLVTYFVVKRQETRKKVDNIDIQETINRDGISLS